MKLSDILDRLGAVDAPEGGWLALCPAHDDSNPSLKVDVTEEGRVLLVDRAGCPFDAIVAAMGVSPLELAKVEYVGQSMRSARTRARASTAARITAAGGAYRAARALTEELVEAPDGPAARMLRERFGIDPAGVDLNVANDLGIGFDPSSARLTVTARAADQAVAFVQGRATDPTNKLRWEGLPNPEGARWDASGFVGRVTGDRTVVITEGPSDGLTVAALDLYDVVAVRGAAQAARIVEVAEALAGRVVVIAADADPAGRAFAAELATRLAGTAREVRVAALPDGHDVGDVRGMDPLTFPERFVELVATAKLAEVPEVPFDVLGFLSAHGLAPAGLSDAHAAEVLVAYAEHVGSGIAHNGAFGYLTFDGVIWRSGDAVGARMLAHRCGNAIRRVAGEHFGRGDKDNAEALAKLASRFLNTSPTDRVLKEVPGVAHVPVGYFDSEPDLLAVANGVVNLRTGKLRPARADDYLTKAAPTAYDPTATAPRWASFLSEVLVDDQGRPDPELVEFMRVLLGYSITGHTSAEVVALLVGRGANGKSKLTGALRDALGDHTRTAAASTFKRKQSSGIPNDVAALAGARLAFTHEAGGGRLDEELVKQITGGDPVSARFLNREFFEFVPACQVVMLTNEMPEIRGQDEGIWRRVKVVRFRASFEGKARDHDLASTLASEAAGILAWLVEGAKAWYASGKRLPACRAVDRDSLQYRQDSDVLGDFLRENVERAPVAVGERRHAVFYQDIWQRYREWCAERGELGIRGTKTFNRALDERIGPRGTAGTPPAHVFDWRLLSTAEIRSRDARWRAAVAEGREAEVIDIANYSAPKVAPRYADRWGRAGDLAGYGADAVPRILPTAPAV